jgi:hypothetical protein
MRSSLDGGAAIAPPRIAAAPVLRRAAQTVRRQAFIGLEQSR